MGLLFFAQLEFKRLQNLSLTHFQYIETLHKIGLSLFPVDYQLFILLLIITVNCEFFCGF